MKNERIGRKIILMAASACVIAASACAADHLNVVIPLIPRENAPVVDGEIDADEWRDSVALAGFTTTKVVPELPGMGGEGVARLACDGETLFIGLTFAARNNDPDGGLALSAKARDGGVTSDDNVEMVVRSPNDENQVYHIFVNAHDVIYDRLWPIVGKEDPSWNCDGLKARSTVRSQVWTCEIALPMKSVGGVCDHLVLGLYRNVPGCAAAQLVPASNYKTGPALRLRWTKDAPRVQMTGLGKPVDGVWMPRVRVSAGRELAVRMDLFETPDPLTTGRCVRTASRVLRAGDELSLDYRTRSRDRLYRYELAVTDPSDGSDVLRRTLFGRRGRQAVGIPMTAEFDLGEVAVGEAYYYPGMNRMRVNVRSSVDAPLEGARLEIAGKKSVAVPLKDGGFTALLATPSTPGAFGIDVDLRQNGAWRRFGSAATFEKKAHPWLNNALGRDRVILPPFKPIAKCGESGARVILRDYVFSGEGLPRQVVALGRDILAAPAHYEIETSANGVERFAGAPPRVEVAADGVTAKWTAVAQSGSGVELRTRAELEYDGFVRNEVALHGLAGRTVRRLTMVFQFRDPEVPLWHICAADTLRHNPAGRVPPGKGLLWDSTRLQRGTPANCRAERQAVPYVWLGAERRGLSWFVNNTCGFKLDDEAPAVRIVRSGDVLRLEIDVVNRPVRLSEGHSFEFGLEATPVKPVPQELARHFQTSCGTAPDGFTARQFVDSISLGFYGMQGRVPFGNDWSAYVASCRRVVEGPSYSEPFRRTLKAFYAHAEPEFAADCAKHGKNYRQWVEGMRRNFADFIDRTQAGSYPIRYSDPTLNWDNDPHNAEFRSEWISRRSTYKSTFRNFLVPSYMDYIVWVYAKEIACGLKGVYMDDMFPITCLNPDTSMRRDDEGKWHGNFGIFEMRELIKRVSVLQHKAGVSPRVLQVHMTNCLLVPSFAFATSTLSWEDFYGEDIFQRRFRPDYILAESIGTQVGCEGVALDGIFRRTWNERDWKDGRFAFLTRTQLALLLPHGVRLWLRPQSPFSGADEGVVFGAFASLGRFGVWDSDCRFVACYDDDGKIGNVSPGVLVASWRKPREALVVFGNTDGSEKAFAPVIDFAALGLPPQSRLYDAETDLEIPGGRIVLPGWDYALVRVAAHGLPPPGTPVSFGKSASGGVEDWFFDTALKSEATVAVLDGKGRSGVRIRAKGDAQLCCRKGIAVRKGDRLRLSVRAKGTGAWGAGVYYYRSDSDRTWLGSHIARRPRLTPGRAAKVTFDIPLDSKDGTGCVCPVVFAGAGATVEIDDFRIEHVRNSKVEEER